MAEDKLTDIQEGDEVGYYGAMKEDGSREKLYGIVQQTPETTKLRVASGKFPGLPVCKFGNSTSENMTYPRAAKQAMRSRNGSKT